MNININYLPNETGFNLTQSLKNEHLDISTKTVQIQGLDFLEINIKDESSKNNKIINTATAIKNSIEKETMGKILTLNGIASDFSGSETIIRTYEVLICDLYIISIRLTTSGKPKEQTRYIRETENSKIAEIAKRSFYLSGLDIGIVTVVLTSKRRLKVQNIEAAPIIREKDIASIVKILIDLYNIEKIMATREITLGADPEFMLFNAKNGKMIAASEFFPRDGIVGCDNIRIPNRQQRPIAEIRPKPNESPFVLIENIKLALANASKLAPYKNVKWVAGSQPMNGYSIGGHIHFSNIKVSANILRALDNYLGLLIFLIEEPVNAAKRRKKYGFIADYREKDHGGFEYRTPSSWLVSQKIATAILCLAKIVASRYPYLPKNYLNNLEAQQAFYNGDQSYFIKYFYILWANLENIDMYKTYAEELRIFPEMILGGLHWDEKSDFRKSWKISTASKTYTKKPVTPSISTTTTNVAVEPPTTNRRTASTATRSTRISVSRTGTTSNQIRTSSSTNVSRRTSNVTTGRIISPTQVRRS